MPNHFWIIAVAAALAACSPNTAEVRCGTSACGANQRCEPKNLVCVLDEAPELVISSPRMGALVSGDAVTVEGSVRDDNGPASLELSTDDGSTWFQVPVSGGKFAAKVGLPALDYQPMTLQLRAHDARQQATKAQLTVQVDNIAPQLALGYPVDGAALGLAWFGGEAKVTGRALDGSGLTSLTIDVGDGPVAIASVGDAFEWVWGAPAGEDGVAHALVVTAVDLAGNRSEVVRAVTVDVVAPQVAFTLPAEDALLGPAFFTGGGRVRGTASPGARVLVELGHGPMAAVVADGDWSVVYRPAPLDFVPQVLSVTATDAAGNTARAERVVIVDVVAPKLSFVGTLNGARLNIASFPQGNDVSAPWNVVDGDAQVEVRNGTVVAPNPLVVTTAPTDNPKAYAVTLKAEDRAGNSAQASVAFEVDRVAPVVTSRRPDPDARNTSSEVSIVFSEPMMGGAGFVLSPASGTGSWTQPKGFVGFVALPDTVFTMNVGPVTDLFGNPVAPQPTTRFHTMAAEPALDTVLMTDVAKFEATVDADGVFHFFTTSPTTPAAYRWARTHPKTGLIEDHKTPWAPTVGLAFNKVQVWAAARANPDLTARRVAAASTVSVSAITERKGWTRFDDQPATVDLGVAAVIPTPAMHGEGAALGEVGALKVIAGEVFYTRAGKPDLATGLGLPTALGVARTRWEMVEVSGAVMKRRSYQCIPTPLLPTCGLTPVLQFNDVFAPETVSVAVGENCSMYAYQTATGWMLRAQQQLCVGKTCTPNSWAAPFAAGEELRVSADGNDTFAWTHRVSATAVELFQVKLSPDCFGADVRTGTFPVPAGAAYQPVVQRGAAALVWVDGTGLKVSK